MFNHCRVSECVHVCVCESACETVWICVKYVRVLVCIGHGTRLCCKEEKKSNEPAPQFANFLSLPFVSATSLIHSDVLLFITKWLLTKLLYLLYKEPTLISSSPPLPESKGQLSCNSSNPQSGFYWILLILLHFLTFIWPRGGEWGALPSVHDNCRCFECLVVILAEVKGKWSHPRPQQNQF